MFQEDLATSTRSRDSATVAPAPGNLQIIGFEKMLALVWYYLVESEVSAENIVSAFHTFDVDGDETLAADELKQVSAGVYD